MKIRPLRQFLGAPVALGLAIIVMGCAGNRHERSTGESVDDTATTTRVKRTLAADSSYRYPNVKVMTFQGTVQLSGFVKTSDQKAKAGELAKVTPGVKDVENLITIK